MTTTQTTLWIDGCYTPADGPHFLIEVQPEGRATRYVLRQTAGRTNQSHEPRLNGWLGSTNNVSSYARGVVVPVKLARSGERTQVRTLEGDELAAALEELGYPDLE